MRAFNKLLLSLALLAGVFLSCEEFVVVDPPKGELTDETIFTDSANAESAIIGLYINMNGGITGISSGGVTLLLGLASDELAPTGLTPTYQEIWRNEISVNNAVNMAFWASAYQNIYRTNAVITGLENSMAISPGQKNRLLAEAKIIRSFCYIHLIQLYGDVPLLLVADYRINRLASRTPVSEIYNQLIEDLKYAQQYLPKTAVLKTRASYYAATALLAKIYLTLGEFVAAENEATEVIESGLFRLTRLDSVFLAGSEETIWSLIPTYSNRQTTEGYEFVGRSQTTLPKYTLSEHIQASFDEGDLRMTSWMNVRVVNGEQYTIPFKYKASNISASPNENYVLLRLAEQYLIRAEARANLNKINSDDGAAGDLYIIRYRSGLLNDIPLSDREQMVELIHNERRIELFCEWGNRWADLKRIDMIDKVLSDVKESWQPSDGLFPIPIQEINANPNLIQNDDYK